MLQSLHIENVAVIRTVDVDFEDGLCVLTGETGAGKSLLIDSLNCLMGGRVNRELIRTGEDRALISAVFSPPSPAIARALENRGVEVPEGDTLMLQRVLTRDGRTVSRINGRAVTQTMLREAGSWLINIHGQSDNQKLMMKSAHAELLDAFSCDDASLSAYRTVYARWKENTEHLASLRQDESERLRTREMLEFQIRDIDEAKLTVGEEEKLTARRDKLLHLEKINRQVMLACRVLSDGEKATVTSLCDRAEAALDQIAPILPACDELMERVRAIRAEAEDIADSVRGFGDEDVGDPTAELDRLEGRLDTISKLGRKYGPDVSDILAFRARAAARLEEIDTSDERIAACEKAAAEDERELHRLARAITAHRKQTAGTLSALVQESLRFLDMPNVQFSAAVRPLGKCGPDGADDVEFLIASNPGEPLLPLVRIASGGELSRIMLAIRSVLNERYGVSTTIYDEVDTGISGRTARKVGLKLQEIAAHTQVICVTHSAQIASLGDAHYKITKQEIGGRAETAVHRLDETQRVDEIARILGGLQVTDSQRAAARELIGNR